MKLPAASLGFKLNLALLLFVLLLGAAVSAVVLIGFSRTQDNATETSQEALEAQGKETLEALAGAASEAGALQMESAAAVGQRAAHYMRDFHAAGGTPVFDASRFLQLDNGLWYDPEPDRVSDLVVLNNGELEGAVLDDIAFSAALDPLLPALAEGFPGEFSGDAYHPFAIIFVSINGVGRYYPPIGIQDTTPPEVDISSFYDRFGPVTNPERRSLWTTPYEDLQGRGLVITAQTPVYDHNDTFRGIFEVDLSISELVEEVNGITPTESGFAFYVDTDGEILETDAYDLLTGEAEENSQLATILNSMREPGEVGEIFVEEATLDGRQFFISYTEMPAVGGGFAVAAPVDELTAQAAAITAGIDEEGDRTFFTVLAAMGALFVVGLIGFGYLNRRVLVRPIQDLAAATRSVAGGDIGTESPPPRGDELQMLTDSFETMVDRLRESESQLEQRVEDRTRELSALIEITRAVSAQTGLDSLVDTILSQLKGVIDYTGASVIRIDGTRIAILDSTGPAGREEEIIGQSIELKERTPDWWSAISGGEPIVVKDVHDEEEGRHFRELLAEYTDLPTFSYIQSWIAAPLVVEGRVLGWISMSKDERDFFTDHHVELAMAIARQAAVAFQNAQLLQQTERAVQEQQSLLEVARTVSSTLDLSQVTHIVLDRLTGLVGNTGASILILEGDNLIFRDAMDVPGREEQIGLQIPIPNAGLIWERLSGREQVIIPDIAADEPVANDYRRIISSLGMLDRPPFNLVRSWMAVPLFVQDRIIGMLSMSRTVSDYFTPDHARLAGLFADHVAVAIENARLFEQAQGLAALEERQRLARDLHDSVSQALYGIALGARTAKTQLERDPAKAADPVDYILQLAEAGLAEMRALIFELRPESMANEGLIAAIDKQVSAARARYGIEIEANTGDEPEACIETKEALYRIAQEGLHNVVKHARATSVNLSLAADDANIVLRLTDNGIGFDPDSDFAGHLGLKSMRERASLRGGRLEITSAKDGGTTLVASIPAGSPDG